RHTRFSRDWSSDVCSSELSEGFGGIKDVLLLGRQKIFVDRFAKASDEFAAAQGNNQVLSQVPRYAMELVAFVSVIFLVLYLLAAHHGNLGTILPVLSIHALAGFKMLPAFQPVYSSVSNIRGNLAAFQTLRDDLRASVLPPAQSNCAERREPAKPVVNGGIELRDIV